MKDVFQKTSLCRGIVFTISWLGMALLLNSCVVMNGRYYDVRKPGEAVNPTSYEFDYSRSKVLSALDSCFTYRHTRDQTKYILSFNAGKIEVRSSYGGSGRSYVYRQKRTHEWFPFYYIFSLKVDSLAPRLTRVDVIYKSSSLYAGDYLYLTFRSFDFKRCRYLDLGSTTIEEYEVLLILGKKLRQRGMPPVHYPGAVTFLHVRDNFPYYRRPTLPFTLEEMKFGE